MWIRGESLNRIQKGRINESDRSRLPCFVFSIMPFTCSLLSDRLNRNTRSREEKKRVGKKDHLRRLRRSIKPAMAFCCTCVVVISYDSDGKLSSISNSSLRSLSGSPTTKLTGFSDMVLLESLDLFTSCSEFSLSSASLSMLPSKCVSFHSRSAIF